MKIRTRSHMLGLVTGAFVMALVPAANAKFYVDYQGIEKIITTTEEMRRMKGSPDGYRVLTDKTFGLVHHIGKGGASSTSSFGADMPLKDAISMLMPEKWIAYVDENIENSGKVDWQAKGEAWIDVLGRIGANYGYRFVVDWDQKLLQISPDEDFTAPDYNDPIALKDPESGRTIFVYSNKPTINGGVILVDGKAISIKVGE